MSEDEETQPAPDLVHWSPRHGAMVGQPFQRQGAMLSATGALAVAILTFGALAVGALAIGALAVGRLAVGRARLGEVEIDRLEIGDLVVRRRR